MKKNPVAQIARQGALRRHALVAGAIAIAATIAAPLAAHAQQQSYPERPVRIVVPFPPGGTVDLVARVLAQSLTEQTGGQFVVDNRSGASGAIGSEAVAKAAPDGYTLLVQAPTLLANAIISKKVPYDPVKDFRPVSLLGAVPMVLTVHPAVPATNLREFVEAARRNPRNFAFGTSAVGSPMHLAQEAIKRDGKLDIPIVVYRGTAGALNDALGGQISGLIDAIPSSAPHIASGKLKPLAVTTTTRVRSLPNVPTVAESGYPGFEMVSWYGLWAPKDLPDGIARRLEDMVKKAMASRTVADRLAPQSFEVRALGGDEFGAFITQQMATYLRIVREANITAE